MMTGDKEKGFAPIVIIIVVAIVITGLYFFRTKNLLVNTTATPLSGIGSAPPIATFNPQPIFLTQPKSTSSPSNTAVTVGKLIVNFHPLYTQENIESFALKIFKVGESTPMISSTGSGKTYAADNIPEGNYLIFVQTGRGEKYCGVSGNGTNTTTVQFSVKPGQQTNLDLNIYPYPGFVYLKTNNGYPIANATVSTGSYTTTTDDLGRAVVYNINPGPYTLNFSYSGANFNQQITGNDCLWIQLIKSPITSTNSTIKVFANTTFQGFLGTDLIVKDMTMNIKPNAIGQNLTYDSVRKYSFQLSHCPGLDGTYFAVYGGSTSTNALPFVFNTVDPGNYRVCVYNASNPDSYASSLPQVQIGGGNQSEVTVDYPKQ